MDRDPTAAAPNDGERARLSRVYWNLAVPFFLAAAFAMLMAPQSQFVLRLICREHYAATPAGKVAGDGAEPPMAYCKQPDVQGQITQVSTALSLCSTIPTILVTSLYGRLSDNPRIGRKPFLMLPIVGEIISILCLVLIARFNLPSTYLVIGYFAVGWSGGFPSFLMAFFALTSELIPASKRTYFFTLTEGAMLSGLTVGPALMSLVVRLVPGDPVVVFLASAALFGVTLVLAQVLVDGGKSAPTHHHHPSAITTGSFHDLYRPWNRTRMVVLATTFLSNAGIMAHMVAFVPYTYRRYGWTAEQDGVFQSLSFLWKVIAIAVLLPIAYRQRHLVAAPAAAEPQTVVDEGEVDGETQPLLEAPKPSGTTAGATASSDGTLERRVMVFGFAAYAVTFVLFAVATQGWMFLAASPLDAAGILAMPMQRSLATQTVPRQHVGLLLGILSAANSLANIVGPIAFTAIYSATVGQWDGAVYAAGAVCWAVAGVLALGVRREDLVVAAAAEAGGADPDEEDVQV
ncbi:hypothetical protein H9P43_009618 [Blastocladiella emersonii ATCC 22665]|nr:hypothetical protein H9P43_009618 [Blastocladiella emersonii ATCC 22665]